VAQSTAADEVSREGNPGSTVLVCSGLDPSGNAGALADLWALNELGAQPRLVITALTAQGTRFAVRSNSSFLKPLLSSALSNGSVAAVKLGLIPDRAALSILARTLASLDVPVVLDPVTRTSRGERLSKLTAHDFLSLARHRVVITPNQAEAEWFGGAAALLDAGFGAVVVKGSSTALDTLYTRDHRRVFKARALARTSAHRGTGCRFATALACGLAKNASLEDSVVAAKRLVRKFLSQPIIDELQAEGSP